MTIDINIYTHIYKNVGCRLSNTWKGRLMRTGRPTTDKKGIVINLRVNEEQKRYIKSQSARKGMSESEYIRKLINDSMRSKY